MTPSRERLIEAHQVAARFYVAALRSPLGEGPREYLRQRALAAFVEDPAWTLGYAPPGWVNLTGHLRHLGFSDTDIATAGLAIVGRRGALLDRFRDRIIVGVHDPHGALVGFVGRCSPKAAGTCPKYLNSPRTPLYAKGSVLFGLAEQRELLASGATPVLVEGPLDVLGIASLRSDRVAVSPCGTAIRPEQARLLRSASGSTVVVTYDADDAGHRAARTAYQRLAPDFDTVLTARLPTGDDPAALAARNPSLLRHALIRATPLADQLIDDVLHPFADRLDNAEARVCALHAATRLITRLTPGDVGRQVARVGEQLDLEPAAVTRDLVASVTRREGSPTAATSPSPVHRQQALQRGSTSFDL